MKKFGLLFFTLCFSLIFCLSASAAGLLSPALSVLQEEATLIKTGIGNNTVAFTAEDFEAVLGEDTFPAICITELPDPASGTLKLGTATVTVGQCIAKEALPALRLIPAEGGDCAVFRFLPLDSNYEKGFTAAVYSLDSLNFAPSVKPFSLSTKESVPVYSTLTAADPEGDAVCFVIETPPKNGTLTLLNKGDGSFVYTAKDGFTGKDSFTYTAVDRYGNRSEAASVSISTAENKSGVLYTDLENSKTQLAAVEMAERGVIVGEVLGGEHFFYPQKAVTRGEFLTMVLSALDCDPALLASRETSYADRDTFTASQNRIIETGTSLGLVVGMDTEKGRCFLPNDPITAGQAATILSRAAAKENAPIDAVAASLESHEEVSDEGYAALASVGLAPDCDRKEIITRADAASLLYTFIGI